MSGRKETSKGNSSPSTQWSNADPGIEAIRAALEGPVIGVLRNEVLALKGLPRNAAYDKAMNDPKMLDECLRLFRTRPELFAHVVTDAQKRPITQDKDVLACGRTLAEAVALVVRASARRYFRAKLDFRARFQIPPPKQSVMNRMAVALGLAHPPPPKKPAAKPHARSEALYQVIRDYLRFDWQVMLIPHYTPMSPSVVSDLGSRLLDIREAAELQALSAPGNIPRDGRVPLLLDDARRLLVAGKDEVEPEMLWRVVQQMDLARLFPKSETSQVRRAVSQVAATHVDVIRALLPVLGGDIRRFTAFLMIAFTTLGEQRFKQDFCQSGQVHAARKLADRLTNAETPPPCLDDMKRVYSALLSTAYVGGVEAGAARLDSQPRLKKALDALGPTSKPVSISG
ncbi:hypothetical protein [Paramagnetospirillum magnetotacticum]|nr:hypothetical protein [Paramagnetospirillum magnetotacticum]